MKRRNFIQSIAGGLAAIGLVKAAKPETVVKAAQEVPEVGKVNVYPLPPEIMQSGPYYPYFESFAELQIKRPNPREGDCCVCDAGDRREIYGYQGQQWLLLGSRLK